MPSISVVMGSYNHEAYLRESVSSILRQTFGDFELVIIDDASGDGSLDLLRSLALEDQRIKLFHHEINRGIARTFNEGLEKATGDFIALTASDDVWMETKLEKQLKIARRNEGQVIWTDALLIDSKGNSRGKLFTEYTDSRKKKKSGGIFKDLLFGNYVSSQSLFFHRSRIEAIRFNEDLKYINDYLFVLELARCSEFLFVPEPLVKYRLHAGNTINRDVKGWRTDMIEFGHYLLRTYGADISGRSRAHIYLTMASACSKLGLRTRSKSYLKQSLKIKPLYVKNATALAGYVKDGMPRFLNKKRTAPAQDIMGKTRELSD